MKPISGFLRSRFSLGAAIALTLSLSFAGGAWAIYMDDGAKGTSAPYANPNDGFCASGIKTDGTMAIVPGITNQRDCVAYTTGLTSMVATDVTATYGTSTLCTRTDGSLTWATNLQRCFDTSACTVQGAVGNDGFKHTYSASVCVDPATRAGISRVDLDNTAANCQEKGGVLADGLFGHPYGACTAYGWQYGGVKADGTLPALGPKGVTSADNVGFCYAALRMTSLYGTAAACPSFHNASSTAPAGEWVAGTDGALYQTPASYDAGLGWSFASSQCIYAYGVTGYLNAALKDLYGGTPTVPLCGGGTGAAAAGTCVDLTQITTQGDCIVAGGTWDNWIITGTGAAPYATTQSVATTPLASTIKKLDATTLGMNGGAKFYGSTGAVCLKCHSDQSRGYQERNKPGYVDTGHKLAGDTAEWATVGNAWGLKGVQCEICHATGRPASQDLGAIIYQTKVCVGGTAAGTPCTSDLACTGGGVCTGGVPRAASGHNQTEYGTHVTGVCFTCHGTAATPQATNPASVIPVASGAFAPTAKNLDPIANEFLNSPHAKYTGTSNKLDIINKTNYGSTFEGRICRTGSEVTDAAILAGATDVTALDTCGSTSNLTCASSANCAATPGGARVWYSGTSKCYQGGANVTTLSTCGAGGAATCNQANCAATPGGNRVWNAIAAACYDMAMCTAGGKTWDAVTNRCVETQTTCVAQSDSGYPFVWSTTGAAGMKSIITASGAGCYKAFNGGSIVTTYFSGGVAHKIPNLDSTSNPACTDPVTGAGGFWTGDGEGAGTTSNHVPYDATDGANCMTCHDVHWSLESTDPEAEPLRRECTTCHVNTGTSASGALQIDMTRFNHPYTGNTPLANWQTDPDESCETCHMPKSSATGAPMHLWRINTTSTYKTMGTTQANVAADGTYANASWVDVDYACGQCHGGGTSPATSPAKPGMPYFTKGQLAVGATGMHAGGTPPPPPPAPSSVFSCVPTANTWTVTCTDGSPNQATIRRESLNWNDGAVVEDDRTSPFGPWTHSYITSGSYSIVHTVVNTAGQMAQSTWPVTWSYFSIAGTVTAPGPLPLGGVTVTAVNEANGLVVATTASALDGTYTLGSLKPGTYTVTYTKVGYTITSQTGQTVGASIAGLNPAVSPALRAVRPNPINLKKNPVNPGTGPSLK